MMGRQLALRTWMKEMCLDGQPLLEVQITHQARSVCLKQALRIRGTDLQKLVAKHPETGQPILDLLARFVSSRWKNAHTQVQSILEKKLTTTENQKEK